MNIKTIQRVHPSGLYAAEMSGENPIDDGFGHVSFKVYETDDMIADSIDGDIAKGWVFRLPFEFYHGAYCESGDDSSLSVPPLIQGDIRFDGCSNLLFSDAYHHMCGRSHARAFGAVMEWLYDMAADIMPESVRHLREGME